MPFSDDASKFSCNNTKISLARCDAALGTIIIIDVVVVVVVGLDGENNAAQHHASNR
jgi:hypothetical protein